VRRKERATSVVSELMRLMRKRRDGVIVITGDAAGAIFQALKIK
jgi:hypothetical protein